MKKRLFSVYLILICIILSTLCTCKELPREMFVKTGEVSNIQTTSAEVTAVVVDLGEGASNQGHCYSKTSDLSISGQRTQILTSGKGDFTSQLTNLEPGTTYYFKAYLSNGAQTVYGDEKSFTTVTASIPTITTSAVSLITVSTASCGGNISNDGGLPVSARGVCWSVAPNPTLSDNKTTEGSGNGVFTSNIEGLSEATTYHLRAYATNAVGTSYGSDIAFTTEAIVLPIVTTSTVSLITFSTASCGGSVISDGGATVIEYGVCWSITASPTISSSRTTDGTGTGVFSSSMTGLISGTSYHVRAYATNSKGTSYGSDIAFTTQAIVLASITTASVSAVNTTTAVCGGNISSDGGSAITARGICWSLLDNPTLTDYITSEGSGTGVFSSNMTGLTPATTYHVRAYATNIIGTKYGPDVAFTTNAIIAPTITTTAVSAVSLSTATSGGNITFDGGATVTERGICWSLMANPTVSDSKTINGTGVGSFAATMTSLSAGTTYHVRAYATNSSGTGYGSDLSFVTTSVSIPSVTTTVITGIKATIATSGGYVTYDGGGTISSRGVCWGTTFNPTIAGSKSIDGLGTGTYSSSIIGLSPVTSYHVRAYATNSAGTAYGSDISFTTTSISIPTVTTTDVSNISSSSASGGGEVTTDGGSTITSRGVCWSINENPTIADFKIIEGTGTGQFTCSLTGLEPGITYYVRAFATNILGTDYGAQVSFISLKTTPVLTTKNITEISAMGGISGGNISSTGGGTISAKGICWGETPDPTLLDNVINSGTGQSSYNSSITTAIPGTSYYVRAFATSETGTGYGDLKTFTALGNVNFYSFESGMLPLGWSGLWTVSNIKSFVGSYCLTSLAGVSSDATLTATLTNAGQISFYYYLDWSGASGFSVVTYIYFYIDDVLIGTFPSSSGWNQGLFNVSAGTHNFRWRFSAAYGDGRGYIDYIVFPQ